MSSLQMAREENGGGVDASQSRSVSDLPSPGASTHSWRRRLIVATMLVTSSVIMAFAWLAHLKLKAELSYGVAILFAWFMVLPEYMLNIKALRMGYGPFTGAQMAAFRLCSGVVAVALVSRFFLDEDLSARKLLGFGVMIVAMLLIALAPKQSSRAGATAVGEDEGS